MRIYITNESYPEIRNIKPGWQRHVTWWKAFLHALRDWRFYLIFVLIIVIQIFPPVLFTWLQTTFPRQRWSIPVTVVTSLIINLVLLIFLLTWGGGIMRIHLRAADPRCASTCPECGYDLTSHLEEDSRTIRCPECGTSFEKDSFHRVNSLPRKVESA